MEINTSLPFDRTDNPDEFLSMEAVCEVVQLLEQLGFSGGNVTDHPCPTGRWLDAGGHHAQDPFVMLSLVAAATTTFKLQTGILVLPYRNPFIIARSIATLDRFSGGRLSLGLGAGYLKGEYRALGVDFDRRNELMDEYLQALKTALSQDEFSFAGSDYEARGNRILPAAAQRPHPSLLVGGNSRRAIRRAVELGDGWYPFFTAGGLSDTARTNALENIDDLRDSIRYLDEHCEKTGRTQRPQLVLGSITAPGQKLSPQQMVDLIGQYAELGVSRVALNIDGKTRAEWCDNARHLAEAVVAKVATSATSAT